MALVNVNRWVLCAQREHFAVGAFNANTLEQAQAIVVAAELEQAPVIIQVSHRALEYVGNGNSILGLRYMANIARVAAESVVVPVGLHLDHAPATEVMQAIALGFTSVMFDGADLPFAENIQVTRALCEQAHSLGVSLEAELGHVPRADPAGFFTQAAGTDPDQVAEFVHATMVDWLAIAIGSVHAVKEKSVQLDLKRLEAIRARVELPLVLHGSSGVTDEDIVAGITLGLCKVNVATQLNQVFTSAIRKTLLDAPDEVDPRKYLHPARTAVIDRVRERIRFLGSAGKAV